MWGLCCLVGLACWMGLYWQACLWIVLIAAIVGFVGCAVCLCMAAVGFVDLVLAVVTGEPLFVCCMCLGCVVLLV